jgi:hypothetical protein
VTGAVNSGG